MGNTAGKVYFKSSRRPITEANDNGKGDHLISSENVEFKNSLTDDTVEVEVDTRLPRGFSGYPVHRMGILDTTDPYSVVSFDHPDNDEWFLNNVPKWLDDNPLPNMEDMKRVYVFTQTGYSVLQEDTMKPVYPYQFSDGVFLSGVDYTYPRLIVQPGEYEYMFEYTHQKDANSSVTNMVNFRGKEMRMFEFYITRAFDVTDNGELRSHFVAQLHAYLFMVLYSTELLGYSPFVDGEVATRLSYPYLIVADLIMYDNYYNYPGEYGVMLNAAMTFIRLWSRWVWDISDSEHFHYGYLDPFYHQAALRIAARCGSHFNMRLEDLTDSSMRGVQARV